MKPEEIVVLVPYGNRIETKCESGLRDLEKMGCVVRRVPGYSAIDQARNQLATDALRDGFEATLWIDSDIGFSGQDVELLLSNDSPFCCGIYVKKGERSIAANVHGNRPEIQFGAGGGLIELDYAGAGFLLVNRAVYDAIQNKFDLPLCNGLFSRGMIPFFVPTYVNERAMHLGGIRTARYLAEDYSFCMRARKSGYKLMADTRLRLSHIGNYEYTWEDAGLSKRKFESFVYRLTDV